MRTRALRRLTAAASFAGALLVGACGDFNVTNPNQPTLDDLVSNPTRTKLSTAATGLFIGARRDIRDFIWRTGSMGREGVLLTGNNQPDFQEPYLGPTLQPTGFGRFLWEHPYRQIRNANVYLTAAPKAGQLTGPDALTAGEVSASLGFGKTLKALAFLYVIATRGSFGAPVDVDRPITDPPGPFVSEDSVYGYILGLLSDAQAELTAAGPTFPFTPPPGFSAVNTPAKFLAFNRALAAKAYLYRATALNSSCPPAGPTSCYQLALDAIAAAAPAFGLPSLGAADSSQYPTGVYFDFSEAAGDLVNDLSDPLDAVNYFALPLVVDLAKKQGDNVTPDQRALNKTAAATLNPPQTIGGFPIVGTLKFTVYLTNGEADNNHPIPVIRNEELALLRAEANIGLNQLPDALTDINFIRTNAGKLQAYSGPVTHDSVLAELLYNRRYSLLWEQGATWVDARRYGLLNTIPIPPGFGNSTPPGSAGPSVVPDQMPVPASECNARALATPCDPLHQQ
jgi:hypothetical protein